MSVPKLFWRDELDLLDAIWSILSWNSAFALLLSVAALAATSPGERRVIESCNGPHSVPCDVRHPWPLSPRARGTGNGLALTGRQWQRSALSKNSSARCLGRRFRASNRCALWFMSVYSRSGAARTGFWAKSLPQNRLRRGTGSICSADYANWASPRHGRSSTRRFWAKLLPAAGARAQNGVR